MSASIAITPADARPARIGATLIAGLFKSIFALISAPEYVLFAALLAMLFRPPDRDVIPVDRICFLLVLVVAAFGVMLRRDRLRLFPASWPMLALLLLALGAVLAQPYDAKAWSVLAARWMVPMAMFHISGAVFRDPGSQRKLEWFSLAVLLYLSVSALFSLVGATSLIFPRYILDGNIGIHADRARGPFLQAVANGVGLNILGLLALHSWERRRLRGILALILLASVPLALLATKTRAVWLSAAACLVFLALFARGRRSRKVALSLLLVAATAFCILRLIPITQKDWTERLLDRSPVEFRTEMYRAGWQMFVEKPLLGWGNQSNVQPELARRVSGFRPEYYVFHNTYLDLGVEHGLLAVVLYAWLFLALFRLANKELPGHDRRGPGFPAPDFAFLWRLVLFAYLLNASAVVMNYQFLNAYVFLIAGILATRQAQSLQEREYARHLSVEQFS